jgi:hypothetical protein
MILRWAIVAHPMTRGKTGAGMPRILIVGRGEFVLPGPKSSAERPVAEENAAAALHSVIPGRE